MTIERRTINVEVRKSEDGRKIRGTAVVFNQLSENLGGFREQISPEAFDGCDMADVRCTFNHDENQVLGRTTSKTLTITRDDAGVHFECDAPDTSYARDLVVSMDRGDVDQCSFSFSVAPGGSTWTDAPDKNGLVTRTVNKISRLYDVSVVTYPAYTQTLADIRNYAEILSERTAGQPAANDPAATPISGNVELRRKLELEFYGRQ